MNNYRRLLFVFFGLSGFSGLIYESIWTRYLKLFLGHAAYAQVLVLAVFMGGMGVGAWLAGKYGVKIKKGARLDKDILMCSNLSYAN